MHCTCYHCNYNNQLYILFLFFFQAEDGIRDRNVTGVQTCALPISIQMEQKFAAQLFTLREELKTGIRPIFKKLKEQGWAGVQISALPQGYDQNEVAQALKENDLKAVGMHIGLDRLESDLDGVLKEADLYGTKDIICPFISEEYRTEQGYQTLKEKL